tara:strand:- start:850 stop:4089 length:3240 start_codon:yes stop_codon:yes gene_type:complete
MALSSPGVQVSVIDESFYTPSEPGTVPMIFVTSAQDKTNGAGTGTAPGTLAANAGKPYLITSQRDLVDTFGEPKFYTDSNNNPIHAGELNEYGLQAAYSFLGVSNRAYVARADIDLGLLVAKSDAPTANPAAGTYWLDTGITTFGLFEWNGNVATVTNGQSFTNKVPLVITDVTKQVGEISSGAPKTAVGAIGDYAITATSTLNKVYYKNTTGTWVAAGSAAWRASFATVRSSNLVSPVIGSGVTLNINGSPITTTGTTLETLASNITDAGIAGVSAAYANSELEIYSTGVNLLLTNGTGNWSSAGIALGAGGTTFYAPSLTISSHTSVPQYKNSDTNPRPTGSMWIKTTEPNKGARWRVKAFNGDTKLWDETAAPIYATPQAALAALDRDGGGINLGLNTLYVKSNEAEATSAIGDFKVYKRNATGATTVTSAIIGAGGVTNINFGISESATGQSNLATIIPINETPAGTAADADTIAGLINSAGFTNIVAEVDSANRLVIKHILGGEFRIQDNGTMFAEIGIDDTTTNVYAAPAGDAVHQLVASNWKVLSKTSSATAPVALAEDGTLWYNSIVDEVDLMIHDGENWVGYKSTTSPYFGNATDIYGPIVSAGAPIARPDGAISFVTGDIWIDTSDLVNYPTIYKYSAGLARWVLVDKSDQTTDEGVLFADARWGASGATSGVKPTIATLLTTDFVDFDAPDPALYPRGMLLWNLRRSGFNVKKFVRNYVDLTADNIRFGDEQMAAYYADRWVTESANQADGSGSFGQVAQRKVVVQSLQAMLNSNQDIRDNESRIFNLMATPGYPELIGEMITLNYDRGLSAFVLGDSPATLAPNATALNEWGTNVNLAVEDNNQGLVSRDEYLGVYYPWGFTSDNLGNNVVVPPSHMMLRTMALSDQVAYPWFAPAGTRRGGITNATATGYVSSEGEFVSISLNEGQRDTLYGISVNPITFITGAGLVAFGQKTRARNASSLDRINVARLVIYMRSQLNKLAKPYIFEPNDKITRDEIKQAAESLCLELVGSRALYDYLVVCDESNNTPSRIDRNELYLDIAIEPVKSVEFIYIPLRLKNTGEIAGL